MNHYKPYLTVNTVLKGKYQVKVNEVSGKYQSNISCTSMKGAVYGKS